MGEKAELYRIRPGLAVVALLAFAIDLIVGHSAYAQNFCSKFGEKTWEQDESNRIIPVDLNTIKNGISYFQLASTKPDQAQEDVALLMPQLGRDNVKDFPFYRIAFFLIGDRRSPFINERAAQNFTGASPTWSIKITSKLVNQDDKAGPLIITNETFSGAMSTSALTGDMLTFDRDLPLLLSPAARDDDPIIVTSSPGAPLLVARYVLHMQTEGVPLGFYDGVNFDAEGPNSPRSCLVRLNELESVHGPEKSYFDTYAQSQELQRENGRPFIGAPPPTAAISQKRVDALTNGVVWLTADFYKKERDESFSLSCTGFMVSQQHVVTARHCVYANNHLRRYDCRKKTRQRCEIRAWRRRGGGDSRVNAPAFFSLSVLWHGLDELDPTTTVAGELDYAVLRVEDRIVASAEPAYATLQSFPLAPQPASPTAIAIPQYPNSRAFVIGYDQHCGTRFDEQNSDTSNISNEAHAEFRHYCDTARGSSGSPVFTSDLRSVIGVHVNGWLGQNDPRYGNGAVKMAAVLADLCRRAKSGDAAFGAADALEILEHQAVLNDREKQWRSNGFSLEQCRPQPNQ